VQCTVHARAVGCWLPKIAVISLPGRSWSTTARRAPKGVKR
jgi:hypothetical protein